MDPGPTYRILLHEIQKLGYLTGASLVLVLPCTFVSSKVVPICQELQGVNLQEKCRRLIVVSVLEPDLEPSGSEIICLTRAGSGINLDFAPDPKLMGK